MEMKLLLIVIVSSIVIYATFLLAREYVTMQTKLKSLDERIRKLESANKLRVPFGVQDELLDTIALLDLLEHRKQIEDEASTAKKEYEEKLLKSAKDRLIKTLAIGTKRESK